MDDVYIRGSFFSQRAAKEDQAQLLENDRQASGGQNTSNWLRRRIDKQLEDTILGLMEIMDRKTNGLV